MNDPLGDHPEMARWTGLATGWGPDGQSRAWFGGRVVDGLVEVLDHHLSVERPRDIGPGAIGCVPWLTSQPVADRLSQMSACCIVTDKKPHRVAGVLAEAGHPFPSSALSGLEFSVPVDSDGPFVIGPSTPPLNVDLGPVRLLGYGKGAGRDRPLLHAKALVLGDIGWWTYDADGYEFEELQFHPRSVWLGSANWTAGSANHLETAIWTDDRDLVADTTRFLTSLIRMSEPFGSAAASPTPDLVDAEVDDEAMAEAAYEQHLAYLDSIADDEDPDDEP